jgi:hypothetical protein
MKLCQSGLETYFNSFTCRKLNSGKISKKTQSLSRPEKPYWREGSVRQTSLHQLIFDQQHFKLKVFHLSYKTSYIEEEVNCTEHSVSICVPWSVHPYIAYPTQTLSLKDIKFCPRWFTRRHNIHPTGTQHDNTQHNGTYHNRLDCYT